MSESTHKYITFALFLISVVVVFGGAISNARAGRELFPTVPVPTLKLLKYRLIGFLPVILVWGRAVSKDWLIESMILCLTIWMIEDIWLIKSRERGGRLNRDGS